MRNPSRLQRRFRDIYVGAAHQVFDERNYVEAAKPPPGPEPSPFQTVSARRPPRLDWGQGVEP
jgi:hypothetical protein